MKKERHYREESYDYDEDEEIFKEKTVEETYRESDEMSEILRELVVRAGKRFIEIKPGTVPYRKHLKK